jgi:hypothetical protein
MALHLQICDGITFRFGGIVPENQGVDLVARSDKVAHGRGEAIAKSANFPTQAS